MGYWDGDDDRKPGITRFDFDSIRFDTEFLKSFHHPGIPGVLRSLRSSFSPPTLTRSLLYPPPCFQIKYVCQSCQHSDPCPTVSSFFRTGF